MRKISILQVVGGLNMGGSETWLMNVLRLLDQSHFHMDFLVFTNKDYYYNSEIRNLGAKIIISKPKSWRFPFTFRRILQDHGPYNIVHSHPHFLSGYILFWAHCFGIPIRVAHSHTDTTRSRRFGRGNLFRRAYMQVMRQAIKNHATAGLAASREAAKALFGDDWSLDPRWRLLYCGLDLTPFAAPVDRQKVRQEFGLNSQDFVVGHIGRFHELKNHQFLIKIANEMIKKDSNTRYLLVGDGPLRPTIESQVSEAGLTHWVIFTGVRNDVPRLMLGAMDVFLFPSLLEGLGLVLVEAQASGLPCVISDIVPSEADIINSLITRLSLTKSAQEWSEEILSLRNLLPQISQTGALKIVEESPFNIINTEIMSFYQEISNCLDG
ncbi:MAG: glycosyltransferase [Syntrophobacterales bacterium]